MSRQASLRLGAPNAPRVAMRRDVTCYLPHRKTGPRFMDMFRRTPAEALHEVIETAGYTPAAVSIRTDDPPLHQVDIMGDVYPGVLGPIASIVAGLTYDEAHAALAELNAGAGSPR